MFNKKKSLTVMAMLLTALVLGGMCAKEQTVQYGTVRDSVWIANMTTWSDPDIQSFLDNTRMRDNQYHLDNRQIRIAREDFDRQWGRSVATLRQNIQPGREVDEIRDRLYGGPAAIGRGMPGITYPLYPTRTGPEEQERRQAKAAERYKEWLERQAEYRKEWDRQRIKSLKEQGWEAKQARPAIPTP